MKQARKPGQGSTRNQLTSRQLTDILRGMSADESDPDLQSVELEAGQILFEQGDTGDSAYVIVAGALGIRVRHDDGSETVIDKLAPGAIVGEMALMSGQPRSATAYALVDSRLICVTESEFEQLLETDPNTSGALDATVAPRWQRVQLAGILRGLLGDLDTASLHLLQEQMEWLHFSNGDVVFRQGDAADGLYVVINGRLRVTAVTGTEGEAYIGEIEPGQTVGEFALLSDEPRAATVYAVRDTNAVRIAPALFQQMVREYPEFVSRIMRIIVERRQRALQWEKPKAPASLSLTLLAAGTGVDTGQFAGELAGALSTHGTTLALNSEQFETILEQPGASQIGAGDASAPAVASRLDQLEAEYKYLLFVADPGLTAWTKRCIGRADRIVVIAEPQADPAPGEVEQMLARMEIPLRTELVLWHPRDTEQPQDTMDWLEARQVHTHYHVRKGDAAHLERMARRLSGKAIAIVLSGGSARGFAHMGVHRALEELSIPLDYVGAVSMGAVMGACFVTIGSNARMMDLCQQFADPDVLFDRTLPFTSIMASKKVTKLTKALFGDRRVEDQWVPFFCVATNLTTAEPVVNQRGPMWRAVRSSLAIPGVFTPVIEDGETLVDGSVMNYFPARLMAQLCESERIIGVNVAPLKDDKRYYDFDTDISGWRILLSRLNPFSKRLRTPSLVGTIMRSMEINSLRRARENESYADVMIYPEAKAFGQQEYHKYEAIAEIGYRAALEPLREWKEKRLTP